MQTGGRPHVASARPAMTAKKAQWAETKRAILMVIERSGGVVQPSLATADDEVLSTRGVRALAVGQFSMPRRCMAMMAMIGTPSSQRAMSRSMGYSFAKRLCAERRT